MSSQVPVFPQDGLLAPIEVESVPKRVSAMPLTESNIDQVIAWIDGVRGRGACAKRQQNIGGEWVTEGLFVPAMPPASPTSGRPIPTASHIVPAIFGQWIIRGLEDEFYPCDQSVFAQSYRVGVES
ncbi:hypothetical protein SEA_RIZWANA_8 [Arthrobacter phage Rizwana]|nr:hypothetical protein SEA_RIZWANA_8 [Arthrobacter phage Rizwana]